MGKIKCSYCSKEFDEDDIIYVEGKPYCQKHYREGEALAAVDDGYDNDEEDSDDDYDEDD